MGNSTMQDAATCTTKRLQCTLLSLLVLHIVGFFFAPFYWTGSLFVVFVLVLGMVGTSKRHTGLLKCYWVVAAVSLVLSALAFLFLVGTLSYIAYDFHAHPDQYKVDGEGDKSELAKQVSSWVQFATEHESQVIMSAVVSLVGMFLITCLKLRSIFLARRLCKQIEQLPYSDDPETIAMDSELDKPEEQQPIYVIPQPMFAAPQHQYHYPGAHQLVPVYVDNFGNPIATN